MGHPPPNHDVRRKMASCTLRTHLKGLLSVNLVFVVVILLLDGETFLVREEEFSCPFSTCRWRRRFALVRRISFQAGLRRCPFEQRCALCVDRPWWGTTCLGRYVQLSGHDLLFPERISANPLPYCFDSGFNPHTFQASWPSPVCSTPEFLIIFNCPIDEHSRNFQWI